MKNIKKLKTLFLEIREKGLKRGLILLFKKFKTLIGFFKSELEINYKDVSVTFDTTSDIAKKWFYPRYIYGEPHEPALTELIYNELSYSDTFFDIGSNLGYFSLLSSKICKEVHSFELDPKLVSEFQESLNRNPVIEEVYLNCVAISDKTGDLVSYTPKQYQNRSTNQINFKENKNFSYKIMTPTLSLDHYCRKKELFPNLLKMDIEGAEIIAIDGMSRVIQNTEKIIIEVHPKKIKNDFNKNTLSLFEKILSQDENFKVFNILKDKNVDNVNKEVKKLESSQPFLFRH